MRAAVAAALALVGCEKSPGRLPPDTTHPQVVSRSPPAGTSGFDLGLPIEVEFSEPIAARSVSPGAVQLLGAQGASLAATLEPSADRKRLTIRPTQPLAVTGADVLGLEVVLGSALTDDAGNALEPPSDRWTFSAPAFLPVGALGDPSAEACGLAWDTQGRLWLASVDREGASTVARVRRHDAQGWTVLPEMGTDPSASEIDLALALGPDGLPVVAFVEANQVFVRRWDGASWASFGGVAGPISGGGLAFRPAIAVSAATGRPVVAWVEGDLVYASRWTGTSFTAVGGEAVPSAGSADASDPTGLALDGDTVLVAWTELAGSGRTSVRVHSSVGGTAAWAPIGGEIAVNSGVETAAPSLAMDGSRPVVTFYEREACPTCERLVQVMRYANGWSSVGPPRNRQGQQHAGSPRILVESADRYVVAWTETPVHTQVHLDRWDGTQWIALERSMLNEGGDAVRPVLAADGTGVPTVAWWESGSPYLMYVRRYNR